MNKWSMFKNYMHNELKITRDDIKGWVEETIKEIAKNHIEHHFPDDFLEKWIDKQINAKWFDKYGHDIKEKIAKELAKTVEIKLKNKEEECSHSWGKHDTFSGVFVCSKCNKISLTNNKKDE